MYSYEREVLERAGYSEVKFEYMVNDCKQFKVFKSGRGYTTVRVKKITDSDQYEIITEWDYPKEDVAPKWALPTIVILWSIVIIGIVFLTIDMLIYGLELLLP